MKYLPIILLLIFCSCANESNCTYIFKKEQLTYLHFIDIKEKFTPSISEVKQTEKILNDNMPAWTKTQYKDDFACPNIYSNMHKYCKQYAGYFNSKGEKIIYLNAFYDEEKFNGEIEKKYIPEAFIIAQDGCSNYWRTEINLNTRELLMFMVNSHGG